MVFRAKLGNLWSQRNPFMKVIEGVYNLEIIVYDLFMGLRALFVSAAGLLENVSST